MPPLLSVSNLSVAFSTNGAPISVVREAGFHLDRGELVGLVGESGSGKTLTALAILRLLPPAGRILTGRIELEERDLMALSESEMADVRGGRMAMIFQEPMTALNPVLTVGYQIAEVVRRHQGVGRKAAWREAGRLLDQVVIPAAAERLEDYPHQLSGGQRQRVMIAMALAGKPDLVIADEPTSALDVTVQAEILELLEELRSELQLAILLITHDLGVVAETCSRVVVMYAGQVIEQAPVEELFTRPAHPYTRGLLEAAPKLGHRSADGRLPTLPGQVPDPSELPVGCSFHPRCTEVVAGCDRSEPPLVQLADSREARCFLHLDPSPKERHP